MPLVLTHATAHDEGIGLQLHRALEHLWAAWQPLIKHLLEEYGLTQSQWMLLRLLCEDTRHEIPMRILSAGLGLTPSGVTRCADPLVARGLVERVMYPQDRRVCCLKPTEIGRDIWQAMTQASATHHDHLLQHVSVEEQARTIAVVSQLAEAAASATRTPPLPAQERNGHAAPSA